MRVLFINSSCGTGSTGRITGELAENFEKQGIECRIAYGRECNEKYARFGYRIGNKIDTYISVIHTRITDKHGLSSKRATLSFLRWANDYNPDLLWLHNIHGYFINYDLLFEWIKSRPNMKIRWTLHDCWAFTGHCGFFTMANCNRWRTGCDACPLKSDYPKSIFLDNSKFNYLQKKQAFCGVKDLTLITPSKWLADLVKESFLKEYPVEVQYNTINTEIFKPTESDFREKYSLNNKTIILGVANVWHKRKGLDDFIKLAQMLNDQYVITLVGFTPKEINDFVSYSPSVHQIPSAYNNMFKVDGGLEPKEVLPIEVRKTDNGVAIQPDHNMLFHEIVKDGNIEHSGATMILITRTDSPQQLAGLYSTADYFVNPTHEDNYPTTNLEAQACGTYVITYDVGGSKETIK